MDIDAHELSEGSVLETDLCIVGAGPAGVALAHELVGTDIDVIVLESGGLEPEPSILALNDGEVVGDTFAALRETRHRRLGGTARLWNTPVFGEMGAKYVPLDAVDFEHRPWLPHSGWPFGLPDLEPFYRRAQDLCGLGPFAYEAAPWTGPGLQPLALPGPHLTTRIFQVGVRRVFPDEKLTALRSASNLRLCRRATVVRLETDGAGRRVATAEVASPGGPRWRVRADRFVLAAGALENARLLLVSGSGSEGLGNSSGWVGRCFMEHPRDRALTLVPRSADFYREAALYDMHRSYDGTPVFGRLAMREEVLRDQRLLNTSVAFLPQPRPGAQRLRDVVGELPGLWRLTRRLPAGGHGWSRVRAPQLWFSGFTVLILVEQAPNPENRVVLGSRRDDLGVPRVQLHWRWRAEEQAGLERLRQIVAGELEAAGLGGVHWSSDVRPDPNAHHHAGTTRMHSDPQHGVVDPDGRVHELENLYLTGGSVFPTAGFANPMLTVVALALRLADHLSGDKTARSGKH
ncbi:MAG: GMC family oxidoreductase [Gemmatimonadota bacterium]|nr:MAG: GMC family oxidoreductase [Gemmatimonadota bacterium]